MPVCDGGWAIFAEEGRQALGGGVRAISSLLGVWFRHGVSSYTEDGIFRTVEDVKGVANGSKGKVSEDLPCIKTLNLNHGFDGRMVDREKLQ